MISKQENTRTHGTSKPFLRPANLVLVFLGGAAGTAGRQGLGLLLPVVDGFPIAIFVANILGAFLLGLLLEALARRGHDVARRQRLRLLLGTGFMGGFTTYSALATDSMLMFTSGAAGMALFYAMLTLVVGGLATWTGIVTGSKLTAERVGGRN